MCYIHIYCQVAMWKNKKKYSHLKKFGEIILQYDLSVKLVKEMISRKFSSKLMREKSRNFQCTVWKFANFSPTIFCKNSVKLTFSLKSYTSYVNQFDEKILKWGNISEVNTPHCTVLWKLWNFIATIFFGKIPWK